MRGEGKGGVGGRQDEEDGEELGRTRGKGGVGEDEVEKK